MKTYGGFLISQIRQLSGRAFEKNLKESGIDEFSGPQGRILYVLWENESLTISQIGRLTSLANTTLTGMLDHMEKNGLITRAHDPNDRRQVLVRATEKAETLRAAYDEVSEATNKIFYAGFSEAEIVYFEDTLRQIIENFERRL